MTTPKILTDEEIDFAARHNDGVFVQNLIFTLGYAQVEIETLRSKRDVELKEIERLTKECERLTRLNDDLTTENKILSGNREADAHDIERLTKEWEVKK